MNYAKTLRFSFKRAQITYRCLFNFTVCVSINHSCLSFSNLFFPCRLFSSLPFTSFFIASPLVSFPLLLSSFIINFDLFVSCCKVHDFCELDLDEDPKKCNVDGGIRYKKKKFLYKKDTNKCCK